MTQAPPPNVDPETESRLSTMDGAPIWVVLVIVFGIAGFGGPLLAVLLWWLI